MMMELINYLASVSGVKSGLGCQKELSDLNRMHLRHRFLNPWNRRFSHEESNDQVLKNILTTVSISRILDFPKRRHINVDRYFVAFCRATHLFHCLSGWRDQTLEILPRIRIELWPYQIDCNKQ